MSLGKQRIIFRVGIMLVMGISLVLSGIAAGVQSAQAATAALDIQAAAGYEGKIKEGHYYPVTFTLNNATEDLSGDLVLQAASPYGGKDITYIKHVDLPMGSTKIVRMALPGLALTSTNNLIKFYKGSFAKGSAIPIANGRSYVETSSSRNYQVAVLARDPDTLNFLSLLNQNNYDLNVVHLALEDIPDESIMLDGIDAIALNDIASEQLSVGQIAAIINWAKRGGSLILAGGAGYQKTVKAFEAIAPVVYEGTSSVEQLPGLVKATGKKLDLTAPFTLSTGALKAGEVVYEEQGIPLFVKNRLEKGEVWYIAYDLALQPLASWNGSPLLWNKVLDSQLLSSPNQVKLRGINQMVGHFMNLEYVLDFFPSLKPPSFSILVLVFAIYMIVVAPLLYLVLRRIDKREWAWVIIPLFSIVASMGIYVIGSADRSSIISHTLNTIELSGSGQGNVTSATAIFVPRGGKYLMELPKGSYVTGYGNGNNNSGMFNGQPTNKLAGSTDQLIVFGTQGVSLQWTNVPYGSVRKARINRGELTASGSFGAEMFVEASLMKGEITNLTKSDLTQVMVMANQQAVRIGDLKIGEKKPVVLSVRQTNMGYTDYGQMAFPYTSQNGRSLDSRERERQMINSYMNLLGTSVNMDKPIIIGWSVDEQLAYKVNNSNIHSDQLNMWVQEIDVQVVKGDKVTIPYGFVNPTIVSTTMQQIIPEQGGSFSLSSGELIVEYRLPFVEGVKYNKLALDITGRSAMAVTIELWDAANQDWEMLELKADVIERLAPLEKFIVDGQIIHMRLKTNQNLTYRSPLVAVEGKVIQP